MRNPEADYYRWLGARIRVLRAARGLTQASLAAAMGVPRTSIVLIEKGRQRVHAYELIQLASALGQTVAGLIDPGASQEPAPRIPPGVPSAIRDFMTTAQATGNVPEDLTGGADDATKARPDQGRGGRPARAAGRGQTAAAG